MRKRLRINSLKLQENRILAQGVLRKDGYYYIEGAKRCNLIWNLYNYTDLILPKFGYLIHHKNAVKTDDKIENLLKKSNEEHTRLHRLGKKHLEESKKKMSAIKVGERNGMFGRNQTEETRRKIGEKNSNPSEETKKKMREAQKGENNPKGMLGKKHSEEVKDKISNAKKGEKNPNFGKKGTMFGKKHSEETKKKISETVKRRGRGLG